ncbi:glycosyltransferase family 4 protein [Cellvibrio sp. PSBB006]|uniref:MraY family glycosyltransferase n=1 Tax=Cellvibrio sp. PSBB006 TaxID=1987723 RepID=UPI000B3B365F|nr:glycosyltransferase family 4 protein [Cellvibrio sp. PSBB006]ARU26802.1 glycosyl transferase [Cellvibrio sp. PSBB006]
MMVWFYLLLIGFLAFALTGLLRKYALARSLVDIPNARSSHSVPTPRGGGVAIVLSFLFGIVALWAFDILESDMFFGLVGAGMIVAVTGFIDDHGHVAARWRLVAHFSAASWGLYWLGGFPVIEVFGADLELGWFGHILAAIYLVWLLNLYNFMDGIDGIAGIEASTVCFGGMVLFLLTNNRTLVDQLPILSLLAATIGFLIWNFPPAKIFMGDAGSGFVGMLLGLFSIMAAHIDQDLFWGWIILLGAFIVDATVTLIRRIFKGKSFYEAHRSHAYQYLSRKLGAHKPVSILFGAINLLILLPIAAMVAVGFIDGVLGVIFTFLPLALVAIWLKAGDEIGQIAEL